MPELRFTAIIAFSFFFFFFNDTATTEIYTLSLHDALPIRGTDRPQYFADPGRPRGSDGGQAAGAGLADRKSTHLNSSHGYISYAVFCLKKKKNKCKQTDTKNIKKAYRIKKTNRNIN